MYGTAHRWKSVERSLWDQFSTWCVPESHSDPQAQQKWPVPTGSSHCSRQPILSESSKEWGDIKQSKKLSGQRKEISGTKGLIGGRRANF